jgi:hypothetical protein
MVASTATVAVVLVGGLFVFSGWRALLRTNRRHFGTYDFLRSSSKETRANERS